MKEEGIRIYNVEDLVLKTSKYYDQEKYNLEEWESFVDVLCGDREYQKEAIFVAVKYMLNEKYNSLKDLAYDNFEKNPEIREKYQNKFEEYEKSLQLPNKKYASIDLATGTGKSYVLYGIAQIMLGLGAVSRVLVLCPSNTIEYQLTSKFKDLTSNNSLITAIPENTIIKNPRIVNATQTIKNGDICVENIHAVYEKTGTSIDDSFIGTGNNTLILNDEAHHIFNKHDGNTLETKNYKKWKEFLLNDKYNFNYMIGVTGTAYIENEYFNDVIYRYSLRQAIEDRIVKNVDYIVRDDEINENERYSKIYKNHLENKINYNKIKPLTILVTRDISKAKLEFEKLAGYISKFENITEEKAKEKILIATSSPEHKNNIIELRNVDDIDNQREWIISVSMLSEGWDVKNVFQIVPCEDRAFNSKLLIAQVLGRGLRLPEEYKSPQPKVIVFNHASWSKNIRTLVDQVLEISDRIYSKVDKNREKYNFTLYNLNYDKEMIEKKYKEKKTFDYTRLQEEGIKLEAQTLKYTRNIEYTDILNDRKREAEYMIEEISYTVEEIVDKVYEEFRVREWEGKTLKLQEGMYTKNELPPRETIEAIIRKSMKKVGITGERLSEKNKNYILRSFNTLLRQNGKSAEYVSKEKENFEIKTEDMKEESTSISNLRKNTSIFFPNTYEDEELGKDDVFKKIVEDETLPRQAVNIINEPAYKTPLNFVITNSTPERTFIRELTKRENANYIDSWIKSRDKGFYSISYTWTKNSHQKSNSSFNPDFFIKQTINGMQNIIAVEIKEDKDDSVENKAKYKYAQEHFKKLNKNLKENKINQNYIFHFLSPNGYDAFFSYLKENKLDTFRCELENLLDE